MLGRRNEIDRERELNTLYSMIANEKGKLEKLKGIWLHMMLQWLHWLL